MSDYRKLADNMLDKFWSPPNFQLNDEQLFMLRAIADGRLVVVPAAAPAAPVDERAGRGEPPVTDAEIDELLALDEKRTPGEWIIQQTGCAPFPTHTVWTMPDESMVADSMQQANAAFIAAAPRMASIIRRLTGRK